MQPYDILLQAEAYERRLRTQRDVFVEDYAIAGKPALIWQSAPLQAVVFDVSSKPLQSALQAGAGLISDNGWWDGFEAHASPSLVFDGISSSKVGSAGWAFQVHVDGSMIAGVWTFPDVQRRDDSRQLSLAPFYVEAFRDFGYVVAKCYEANAYQGASTLTCTMNSADMLALVGARDNIVAEPVKRKTLRWPLIQVSDLSGIEDGCRSMAVQLMRAYGKTTRPW